MIYNKMLINLQTKVKSMGRFQFFLYTDFILHICTYFQQQNKIVADFDIFTLIIISTPYRSGTIIRYLDFFILQDNTIYVLCL